MPWDAAKTRRDSQPSEIDVEIAARTKLKAEQLEKEKQMAVDAKKAAGDNQKSQAAPLSGGLFRMVAEEFEAPQSSSPEVPRRASKEDGVAASVAYPVNAQLPIQRSGLQSSTPSGRERGVSADRVIERGLRASKEFFGDKDTVAIETPQPEEVAPMPPPPSDGDQSSGQLFMMNELFEQLRAERQRADRLEAKVNSLTEELVEAHEKIAGVLERENQRWAQVHQLKSD